MIETIPNLTRSMLNLTRLENINNINMLKIKNVNIDQDMTPYDVPYFGQSGLFPCHECRPSVLKFFQQKEQTTQTSEQKKI